MIKSIVMRDIKGANTEQELTGRDIIIGNNGSGKTTRAQAIGAALMGYVPGGGKLPSETIKLASGSAMTVGLKTDGFEFSRTFARKGAKIEQSISLMPPHDENTAAEKGTVFRACGHSSTLRGATAGRLTRGYGLSRSKRMSGANENEGRPKDKQTHWMCFVKGATEPAANQSTQKTIFD
jgi:hypothetical protein